MTDPALSVRQVASRLDVDPAKDWLSVGDAARALGVHPETIRLWIRSKRLSALRPGLGKGRPYRLKRADVQALRATARVSYRYTNARR